MSVKLSRISTNKNMINNMWKNYEVTIQNFSLQTSKLFEWVNCIVVWWKRSLKVWLMLQKPLCGNQMNLASLKLFALLICLHSWLLSIVNEQYLSTPALSCVNTKLTQVQVLKVVQPNVQSLKIKQRAWITVLLLCKYNRNYLFVSYFMIEE